MAIHYLGPSGTFSEQAAAWFAARLGSAAEALIAEASISDALLAPSATAVAVVPYYNLIDGLITETVDRILQHGLSVAGALRVPVRMAAGHGDGVRPDTPVYSHPKALAQCSDYLTEHHPQRERVAVSSTAEGVELALARGGLALASTRALEARGARVLVEDATNNYMGRTNYTEFVLITGDARALDDRLPASDECRCQIVCDPQDDRPGLLAGMLSQLAFFNLNLARIHARPARGATPTELDPQVFFLEIAGGIPPDVRTVLVDALALGLKGSGRSIPRILGEYPLYHLTDT